MKRWIIHVFSIWLLFQQRLGMSIISWAGADMDFGHPEEFRAYIPADPRITPLVVMAAWKDEWSEERQSELNACMESLRQCDVLLGASQRMLGELSVKYGVEEAFVRMTANHVLLGLNLQRRLSQ